MIVMTEVKKGVLSVAEAARAMGVCYRQAKRIWRRFARRGEAGLIHRSRGQVGPRRKPSDFRRKVLARYARSYPDFGPTLAAEKLQEGGFNVDHETLRRWLIEEGLWTLGRRQRKQHRAWRERRECFGQMVQLDGSHHDWFEGRRAKAVLMVMIDDATNKIGAHFFEEETTEASYGVFEAWAEKHGLPGSLYVDRDSIYRCERLPSVEEQIAGKEPQTQFGRVMAELGVELILAHSPQAKGRVERCNGTLQDRLVKELRLAGINDLESANEFLEKVFLPKFNARFTIQARRPVDAHRRGPWKLSEGLNWEETRVVAKDWTVAWKGRWFQIPAAHQALNLPGEKVTVRKLRSGAIQLLHKKAKLTFKELRARPERARPEPRKVGRTKLHKPQAEHPWRGSGVAAGKTFWRAEKTRGKLVRRARDRAVAAASGQPSLRSGFPPAAATAR